MNIHERYKTIDNIMKDSELSAPVECQEEFSSSVARYRFFKDIHLSVPIEMLRYSPGGSHVTVVFLFHVKNNRSAEETTQAVHFYEKVRSKLPVFHTREMKKLFKLQFQNISKITPSLLETV